MNAGAMFGAGLLEERRRDDAIGELARTAAADADFPRDGDYPAVFAWAWEAAIADYLLEVVLPAAGAEHERGALR
jgi:hypothetical protein